MKTQSPSPHEHHLTQCMKTYTRITQRLFASVLALPFFLSAALSVQAQIPTTTTLSGTGTNDYGTSITITAEVDDVGVGSSLVFYTNDVPIATNIMNSSDTSITIDNLPVGTYSFTAVYQGDPTYELDPSTSAPSTELIIPASVTIVSGL